MNIDSVTRNEMFEVLRLKVVDTGSPAKIICFKSAGGSVLCNLDFDDIIEDSHILGEFYFQDPFGSRILKGVSVATGTVETFEIYDSGSNVIVSGSVTLLNAGGDITFNAVDWLINQAIILSSLKIVFPTGE